MHCRGVFQSSNCVLYSRFGSFVNGRMDVFPICQIQKASVQSNQRLFSRNGDLSNVNEQVQINDNIYIYDEINDLDLDASHEMYTTNNLNHEITSGANIIDIDESNNTDDMGYEMPSKSMRVDENINDILRNRPTLVEDDIAESGYLNPYQPLAASFRLN